MATLRFDQISKRFNDVLAVDRFDIEIREGEFVALVGPSGCGKTTSLRMLAGLEPVSDGRLFIDGTDVTHVSARNRNLGMVFQSYALYPHLTVAKNIGFSLSLKGMATSEIETRVRGAAQRMSIEHLLHRRPKELSGGQRQRVAVARCIVREPSGFLFDEPLSNLDAKLRGSARIEISRLQKALGITTLYVTHDQVEAMTMADRIVLMDGGRIRQLGAPLELYHNPDDLFVATFLGAPAMNIWHGELQHDGERSRFETGALVIPLPDRVDCAPGPASLGFRPETIAIGPGSRGHSIGLRAILAHVERLGAETLVQLAVRGLSGQEVIARLPGTLDLSAGDGGDFHVPTTALRLFDADGLRVSLPTPSGPAAARAPSFHAAV